MLPKEEKRIATILGRNIPPDIYDIYTSIVSNLECKILVNASNRSETIKHSPDSFEININVNTDENYIWEMFLHEHIHVLQTTEGYRNLALVGASNKLEQLIYIINDFIMDIDVNRRLFQHYNFQKKSGYGDLILSSTILNIINSKLDNELKEFESKYLSCFVAFITLQFSEGKGELFAKRLIKMNSNFEKYYIGLIKIATTNHQIGYTHVRKMQVQAMALFDLKCYKFV